MNLPNGFELFAILAVFVLLFGSKKLPDAARSLGRSMRIFKAETKGLRDDDKKALPTESAADREAREFAEWKAARASDSETR